MDTTKSPKVNFANNNDESEPEEIDEDDLIKDIANDFSAVGKKKKINQKEKIWLV